MGCYVGGAGRKSNQLALGCLGYPNKLGYRIFARPLGNRGVVRSSNVAIIHYLLQMHDTEDARYAEETEMQPLVGVSLV